MMNNYSFSYFYLFVLVLLLNSCIANKTIIQKSEDLRTNLDLMDKIVMIEPEINKFDKVDNTTKIEFLETASMKDFYVNSILKMAKKNKVNLEFFSKDNLSSENINFYNDLLSIKQDIINANYIQDYSLNNNGSNFLATTQQSVFTIPLSIKPELSSIYKKYDTPFFGTCGMVGKNGYSIWYFIVVDIFTSEVIYREYKKMPYTISKKIFKPSLYDSFYNLKNNIN